MSARPAQAIASVDRGVELRCIDADPALRVQAIPTGFSEYWVIAVERIRQ